MLSPSESKKALRKYFCKNFIADINQLFHIFQTTSRMSVFRRLKLIGYITSFTDAGRYYTLDSLPTFDSSGLWFYKGVGFSKFGTLKATVIEIVHFSVSGITPNQMLHVLKIRVPNTLHNALHGLVKEQQISRHRLEGLCLYTNANPEKAHMQIKARRQILQKSQPLVTPPSAEITIAVLVEALRTGKVAVSANLVAQRLTARGLTVTVEQVSHIFDMHGISSQKKMAHRL